MKLKNVDGKKPRYGFKRKSIIPKNKVRLVKIEYRLKSILRKFRINRSITKLFGPQYKRSRDLIEIDITYRCNLNCFNCNRSVRQAPEALDISLDRIEEFVSESISKKLKWKRIRVLGGEPTLHPKFLKIIDVLNRYIEYNDDCEIQVVTNGYGEKVNNMIKELPDHIWVENSRKFTPKQEGFAPFNLAPCDDEKFTNCCYENGCAIMEDCGMGLTPLGYYPCAVSGGIDRIIQKQLGYQSIPDMNDDMINILNKTCIYCGRFYEGHYVPQNLRKRIDGQVMSMSWEKLYTNWKPLTSKDATQKANS